NDPAASYRRPVRIVQLGKNAAPLVLGGILQGFEEGKDFSWLFAPNYEWIGVLFLNPLSTPRALIGDTAVYWASSFAAQGYPSLRIDLPGLGDSYGELPKDLLTFIN